MTSDAGDESLQRYKQSLGLGGGKDLSDASDPRVCIIQSLTMDAPGRDPVTIDLSAPGSEKSLKDKPFKIKEGAKFTMSAKFKVQHEILSGLHYVQIVKRKGIKVSKDSEMIVGPVTVRALCFTFPLTRFLKLGKLCPQHRYSAYLYQEVYDRTARLDELPNARS